ncbi:ABC transporter ATP-binding protein [Falsigemmobacter faecalis]|uniref:ABC transporter ATP-binding protein n=1 Tax=Falsigemmobacter faecalis TaxID=2488730 RepID=A0A3P3D7Z5_9RHOB|nr:ABC transporter ATP-binding protein [Falsigemmobacter faecalis]RRH70301.1 ABC transporter ATP-binding protein [Falsigemmobacter faecalis]
MTDAPPAVLKNVSLRFPGAAFAALEDVSLELAAGEVVTILGPSGCGKTTLLRLIAGLVKPDSGSVRVFGAPPVPGARSALVFQNFRLLPWKTVAENVGFVLADRPAPARRARVQEMLAMVGLSRFAESYPRELSGGMQQRVALARALAADPDILLMDEPFASLDAQSRELMQAEISRLSRQGAGRSVVFVTHSVDEALVLGDRVVLMSPRPGRVAKSLDLPFRGGAEARRNHPDFSLLRGELWAALREMVLSDPQSDFHGRGLDESNE